MKGSSRQLSKLSLKDGEYPRILIFIMVSKIYLNNLRSADFYIFCKNKKQIVGKQLDLVVL